MLASLNLSPVSPRVHLAKPKEQPIVMPRDSERIADLAKSLGLDVQAKRHRADVALIPKIFARAQLTREEEVIWGAFCPRVYTEREFAAYQFDTIPAEVIEHWTQLKQFPWDTFEIRTTEATKFEDPLLIGVYQNVRYLLARWGEEAATLLSFDEVKRQLKERELQSIEANADYVRGEMGMSVDNVVVDSYALLFLGAMVSAFVGLAIFRSGWAFILFPVMTLAIGCYNIRKSSQKRRSSRIARNPILIAINALDQKMVAANTAYERFRNVIVDKTGNTALLK
jgi:hypothetical protein